MGAAMSRTEDPSFAIPPSVLYRDVDGQMVLLNLDTEQYYGLNEVGAHILGRITKEPFAVAFEGLVADYNVDRDLLNRDVDKIIDDLIAAGLLERVDPD